jgi:hypothetical protein
MSNWNTDDRRLLGSLLSPSWLSGLVVVIIGLVITLGTFITFNFDTSAIQQQLVSWQQNQPERPLTTPYESLPSSKPTLQNTWPLLLVWGIVGLVVYAVAINVTRALSDAAKLRQTMDYVNALPKAMLEFVVGHIALRVLAVLMAAGLLWLFFKQTIPYSITAAHASAVEPASLNGFVYALLSFAIVVVHLHLIIIFARLATGRPRVFA